jgi:UPF0716 protein FxsA
MALFLLAAFTAVPVIEIALFIEVGGWIGLWPTIAIVVATAFAGTTLLRLQGLAVLQRAQESAARNELPVAEVYDGLCLLVAGVLLLTPGFFTDVLGFLIFIPVFRHTAGLVIWRWLVRSGRVSVHTAGFGGQRGGNGPRDPRGRSGTVIDGDYEEVDPAPSDRDRLGPR